MTEITHLFPEIVRTLIPQEPSSTSHGGQQVRYGTYGSLAINFDEGSWFDHERQVGGGVLDFIRDQVGLDSKAQAMQWLEDKNFISKSEPQKPKIIAAKNGTLVATYDYIDENGALSYQVLRYKDPRSFRQRQPDETGNWQYNLKGITPLPYRLPDMLQRSGDTIIIVEGEKDADNLAALGLIATTNNGGSKNFSDKICHWFTNRVVIIIPDNDAAGEDHAQDVAMKLHPYATSIRIVHLPNLQPKGDVSDWITNGGDKSTLIAICKAAPYWEPPQDVEIVQPQELIADYHSPLVHFNDKGKPINHIDNLREIINRLGVVIRYNIIAKEDEILIPGKAFTVDNKANATLAWLQSECSRFNFPTSSLKDFVLYLADQNLFNPVAAWIDSKPWDGVSRLKDLYNTITTVNPNDCHLKEILIFKWLLAAIAAAYSPFGVSAPGMLVLQGDQYLGKTKWFKSLAPEELGLWKDGMLIRPDNKDSVKQACSFWLVELGELDSTFKKSDISQLKAFITNKSDVLRRAFAAKDSHYARRTVFFGSVNPKQFLNDPTGNRRFWTVEAAEINHSHNLDMQQIWAEVLTHYRNGESYFLTGDELDLLNAHNEEFTSTDPITERIISHLAWEDPPSLWQWNTATDILISIGIDKPLRSEQTAAGDAIRKLNGNQTKRRNSGRLLLAPKPHFK